MLKRFILLNTFIVIILNFILAQNEMTVPEVIIERARIDLPFSESAHSITVIQNETLNRIPATNLADVFQNIAGIDVRRRGTDGMQADLYIRGGSFEQTLLLIDGLKVDDAQTGHHTMNMIIPFETIERIEIIKGPAARIFGQNAFSGAINIVTKAEVQNQINAQIGTGSFGRFNISTGAALNVKNTLHQVHYSKNTSNGYRYNTDYNNDNVFLKSTFFTQKNPLNVIVSFQQRKFGANGFYASPTATEQYEETQTSLVGLSSTIKLKHITLKPRLYWRRNQDNYLFIRSNPSIFENFHISNKITGELQTNFETKLGQTGVGVEIAQTYLSSNNLGNRQRTAFNLFVEHRMQFFKEKLAITPGVSLNYFTDFKFFALPGLDIGFKVNQYFKIFGNIGYTYRIPTYTELYYNSPTTLGNEKLKPEGAFSQEIGAKANYKKLTINVAGFHRDAFNLIDYTKENELGIYQASNIRKVNTFGFETDVNYGFRCLKQNQNIKIGYTYMYDNLSNIRPAFSRYVM